MLGRQQAAARLQRTDQRLQQRRLVRADDPEHAQLVMPALHHAIIMLAQQHFLDMAKAITLPGAIDGGQDLARQFGHIADARCVQAVVAIAAGLGRMFAKVAQQHGTAAAAGFDQRGQRVQPGALAHAAGFVHFLQPHSRAGEIVRTPQHDRHRRIAIAPRASGFLIVALDRFGDAGVGNEPHVGLVDSHAEGHRGDHHHLFGGHERRLVGRAHFGRQPCVIGQHRTARGRGQLVGQLLHLLAGRRIDDAGAGLLGHQRGQLTHRVVAVADGVADVGPVKPGNDQAVSGNPQLRQHIGAGLGIGGGGQGQARDVRKRVHQRPQRAIVRAEIVAPFGHAVRFVDGEQADGSLAQQLAEMALAGAFGRDVEQVQLARAEPVDGLLAVGIDAGQRGGADAVGQRRTQLVVHQRDQRGNDNARPRQHHGGQLIGQRFARAGRHHCQRRLPVQHTADHLILHPAKGGKAEGGVQLVKNVGFRHAVRLAPGAAKRKGQCRDLSTTPSSRRVKVLRPRGSSSGTCVVKNAVPLPVTGSTHRPERRP